MISLTGTFLPALWLSAAAVSFYVVRDAFSPDKLVLAMLGLFFGDIFFHDYSLELCFVYALLILTLVVTVVVLARGPILRHSRRMASVASAPSGTHFKSGVQVVGYKFFWLVSLPALVAQVYMIQIFGGIEGYINSLGPRVVEFRGLGPIIALIRTYSIVNLIYFSFLVTRRKRKIRHVVIYGLHLLIFVVMALLTGSRGSLLINFVLMALIYHHSVRRIRTLWLFIFAVGALLAASVLEVARQGVAFKDGVLITGLSEVRQAEKQATFGWAKYGLIPLESILEAGHVNMYYGFTYLTVLTNIIPRDIWPTKPATGGVILTKEYTSDAWRGFSNLSTGIIPEAIINFGKPLGILFGVLQFAMLVGGLLLYYAWYRRRLAMNDRYKFIDSVRFSYITWGMAGLIAGEFTNVMLNLVIQLTTVWAVYRLIRLPPIGPRARLPRLPDYPSRHLGAHVQK